MNWNIIRIIFAIAVVSAAVIGIIAGVRLFHNDSGYEAARNSLNRLALTEERASIPMARNAVMDLHNIGQSIAGPVEDPDYYVPVSGPLAEFLVTPEMQKKTRDLLAKNGDAIRNLQTFYKQKRGVQAILAPEELPKFRRSIGRIINLCCDRMALAILEHNREQAGRILDESCYFLTVNSPASCLREFSDFSIALTVWQVHIFGTYVNTFPLTEREIDSLSARIQTLQERLNGSFRSALTGESFALFRQFSAEDPRLSWRIDRYDDYFHRLKRLPEDRWKQAERIFQVVERISSCYSNFHEYYAFADSLQGLEKTTDEASPFTRNFCRLFWPLCRSGAVVCAQFQCDRVKLAVLKFWNQQERLPRNLAELAVVKFPEGGLIDPFTGRSLAMEISPEGDRIQILHGGRNWGNPIRLSRR